MRSMKLMRPNGSLTIHDDADRSDDDAVTILEKKTRSKDKAVVVKAVTQQPNSYHLLVRVNWAKEFDALHPPGEFRYLAWVSTEKSGVAYRTATTQKNVHGLAKWHVKDVVGFNVDRVYIGKEAVYVELVRVGVVAGDNEPGCSAPERVVGRAKCKISGLVQFRPNKYDFTLTMVEYKGKFGGLINISTLLAPVYDVVDD